MSDQCKILRHFSKASYSLKLKPLRTPYSLALTFCLCLPWLLPPLGGPTPVLVSVVFSWTCVSVVVINLQWINARHAQVDLLKVIPNAFIAAAILNSVIGILQYMDWARLFEPFATNGSIGVAYGNLRQRNQFATLTNIGLAALLNWSEHTAAERRLACPAQWPEKQWQCAMVAVTLAVANAASASRTGLLQLIILTISFLLILRSRTRSSRTKTEKLLLMSLMGYLISSIALPLIIGLNLNSSGIYSRFQDGVTGCQSRLTLWSNVLYLIAQKPWLGWGWGELDYAHFITLYPGDRFCDILDNAHNLPLHLAVELGIPVSIAFCSLCVWLVAREKPWREQKPMRQLAWIVLALIALHSMLEYPLWYGPFQITAILCVYILWRQPASWRSTNVNWPTQRGSPPKVAQSLCIAATAVILGCAYVAWDYWRVSQIYIAPAQRASTYRDDTLHKIQASWLFRNQVRFAELSVTPLTYENAQRINTLAKEMLHFSPEASVVEKLIQSAVLLGNKEEAEFYLQRLQVAFPGAEIHNK